MAQELRWKAASLPPEPPADDAEAVSLAVRLPAGGRYSRRFRRSDTLQVRAAAVFAGCCGCAVMSSLLPCCTRVSAVLMLHAPISACQAADDCCCHLNCPCLQSVFDFVDVQSGTESGAIQGAAGPAAAEPAGGNGAAAPAIRPGSYSLATSYPRRVLQARGCWPGLCLGTVHFQLLSRMLSRGQLSSCTSGPAQAAHSGCLLSGAVPAPALQDGPTAAGMTLAEAGITSKQEALFLELK